MNIQVLDKTYLAEVNVPASSTGQQFNFPTLNNLDGKYIQGLSAYGVVAMPLTPSRVAVVNAALFNSSFLNLFVGDENQYWNLPLIDCVTVRNSLATAPAYYNPYAIEFNNVKIIWAKSFIFVANTALIAATVEAYAINIKYTDGVVKKEM